MTLTTAQIITEYNAAAEILGLKTVKKFQDRATAERRLQDIQGQLATKQAADRAQPNLIDPFAAEEPTVPQKPDCEVTDAEFVALNICLNYDKIDAQLCDNYSNGDHAAFKAGLGWNDQAVAALIGSLEKKDLAYSDNEGANGKAFNTVWLTPKGVHAVFYYLGQGREIIEPKKAPVVTVTRVKDGKKVEVKEKALKKEKASPRLAGDPKKSLAEAVAFMGSFSDEEKPATVLRATLEKFEDITRVQFRHSAEEAGFNGLTARNLFDRVRKA